MQSFGSASDVAPVQPGIAPGNLFSTFLLSRLYEEVLTPVSIVKDIKTRGSFIFSVAFEIVATSLVPTKYLYILFNGYFSESKRADIFTCSLFMTLAPGTNYASVCEMETTRLLRITIASTPVGIPPTEFIL